MVKPLSGYCPIIPTPYTDDNQLDLEGLRRLTRYLIEHGAHGLSPNGGDSEARYLTEDERKRALDAIVETNAGRIIVLVGCSATTTVESARLCRHAQASGADGVFVMPPEHWAGTLHQADVTDASMLAHYQTIAEGLDLPIMVHGTANMTVAFLQALLERVPTVRYVKEETNHGPKLRAFIRELGDRLTAFGPGLHYPAELAWGAMGVMPSCCAAHAHARVFDLWRLGDQAACRVLWNRMLPLVFWRWHTAPGEAGKWFLMHEGVFGTRYTRPEFGRLRLDEQDYLEMRAILETLGDPPY